jgi:predicted nucleic acid-binding protein
MATGLPLPETALALDTTIFTHWRNRQPYVHLEIAEYMKVHKRPPALTSMTVFEAIQGVERAVASGRTSAEDARVYFERIEELKSGCTILPFDQNAATVAAYIYARLTNSEQKGLWKDLFIAATAVVHGFGVATQNRKDFDVVGGHLPPNYPLLRLAVWRP